MSKKQKARKMVDKFMSDMDRLGFGVAIHISDPPKEKS
jgi:hypothetical protein